MRAQINKEIVRKMKKIILAILSLALALGIGFAAVGCAGGDTIVVCGREASSGTREAFDKVAQNAEGESLEDYSSKNNPDEEANAGYVSGAQYFSSTGTLATKVAQTKGAIGYISLSSVDESVKALNVEGVEPTEATVLDGTYKIQRPFVFMWNKSVTLTNVAQDFLNFLKSQTAQDVVKEEGGVSLTKAEDRNDNGVGTYTAPATAPTGDKKIVVRGSTSMNDLMDALIGKYCELNASWIKESDFDMSLQGSSTGRSAVDGDTVGNVIGMASSAEAADTPRAYFNVALDAVAVVVNPENELENITLAQLYDIYTGAVTKWSEIK